MISIFICEDDITCREMITSVVSNYIEFENLDMKIVCSTATPDDVIGHLQAKSDEQSVGLYFLDLDLCHELTGITLAEVIRTYDPRGFIVFVTADAMSHVLTFKYKVEAMDYIVKSVGNLQERICECIENAKEKYTAKLSPLQDTFVYTLTGDLKGRISTIERSKIMYFEASAYTHNIILHTNTSRSEFRGTIKNLASELDTRFVQCHRAIIVNMNMVSVFHKSDRQLELINGAKVDVAHRYVKKVENALKELNNS